MKNLAQFRHRLLAEQQETIEAIQQAQQSAAPVELDQSSIGRVSRIDALQQQALAQGLLQRLVIRRRKVEAALTRFDSGTWDVLRLSRGHRAGTAECRSGCRVLPRMRGRAAMKAPV
jgi:DnaK suppressor protein